MAGSYSRLNIQIIFAVQGRRSLISQQWDEELYKYITGIVQKKGQKMLAINGVEDHIHFLIGMRPACCLSDLVREVKKASHAFIKEERLCTKGFNWQEGAGYFSYSENDVQRVINYIHRQKEHHHKITFHDEYTDLLKDFEIPYEERFLFEWND